MGPIDDHLGLEQGGVNSDKLYINCNNNQLSVAQKSELGVDTGAAVVSAIGQADDTVLLSNDFFETRRSRLPCSGVLSLLPCYSCA